LGDSADVMESPAATLFMNWLTSRLSVTTGFQLR
jgi:hypothetical protein